MADESDHPFMPSQWCQRGVTAETVLQTHVDYALHWSSQNRTTLQHDLVKYRPDDEANLQKEEALEWYHCQNTSACDTVVAFIHGGYWQAMDLEHSAYMAHTATHNWGTHFASLGYTTAPQASLPEMIQQVAQGVKRLMEFGNPLGVTRIFLAGHSAGAHLALAALLYTPEEEMNSWISRIQGVLLLSGVFQLEPLLTTSVNVPLQLNHSVAVHFSITSHLERLVEIVKSHNIRVFLTVGEHEPPFFHEETRNLFLYLEKNMDTADVNNESVLAYHFLPDYDHFHVVERLTDSDDPLARLICQFVNYRE